MNSSLRVNPLDYYRREKFDYLVASSYVYGRYHLDLQAHSDAVEYYQQLDRECPLVVVLLTHSRWRRAAVYYGRRDPLQSGR